MLDGQIANRLKVGLTRGAKEVVEVIASAARRLGVMTLILGALVLVTAVSASADTTYNPPAGTWNGYTIYLSQACHDGNDGVPGGPCIPNYGCYGYNENTQSASTASTTIYGGGRD